MYTVSHPDELYHYGRKGMKWGQNIFGKRKTNPIKQRTKEYRTSRKTDPKTDFLKLNRPNSAARNYYRSHRTHSFSTYRRQQAIMDRKVSGLTKDQIENGRYRVARFRNMRAKAVTGLATAGVTAVTLGVAPVAALAVAPVTALGLNWVTGGHYYQGESATYGSRRAERELKQKK